MIQALKALIFSGLLFLGASEAQAVPGSALACCVCENASEESRAQFQEELLEKIQVQHPNKAERLAICSYASGELLQEYMLISALLHLGYTNLALTVIDPIYGMYRDNFASDFVNALQWHDVRVVFTGRYRGEGEPCTAWPFSRPNYDDAPVVSVVALPSVASCLDRGERHDVVLSIDSSGCASWISHAELIGDAADKKPLTGKFMFKEAGVSHRCSFALSHRGDEFVFYGEGKEVADAQNAANALVRTGLSTELARLFKESGSRASFLTSFCEAVDKYDGVLWGLYSSDWDLVELIVGSLDLHKPYIIGVLGHSKPKFFTQDDFQEDVSGCSVGEFFSQFTEAYVPVHVISK